MAKPPLGSGERFAGLKKTLAQRGAKNPGALAAWIGSKRWGRAKMQKMAAAGHKSPNS